jgi:acetyl-CoA/propionyl-CoA carboxylase biotin carboxyl carrier protein
LEKLLVANRGEIAVRVIRTARETGLQTVAVYSEIDRDAMHVRLADEAYLLGPASPAQSYLNAERILEIARRSGAQAVHPGYGFLAENADFARAVSAAGLTWVGPHPDAIDAMGDKMRARQAMIAAGVPVVPGGTEQIADVKAAIAAAEKYGLPLALKASGGGGGKGLKVAYTIDEVGAALSTAKREAEAYFKNGAIYAERYLENPKHIELQILADKHGTVLHVGERDCSLQRRHQKLWEETPPGVSKRVREGIREAGLRAAKAIGYDSVGTIEWLVSGEDFYFLEMNTRIQVEHTVTEMISGLDLVREQIRVAAGEPLGYSQEAIVFSGHSIEGRINAEDPANDFRPAPGTVTTYREPGGLGVRIDSAAFPGFTIGSDYDSLIAKLVVWAPSRDRALARFRRALDEYVIEGVPTTLPLLRQLCDHPPVMDGTYTTSTLETFAASVMVNPNVIVSLSNDPEQGAAGAQVEGHTSEAISVEVNDKLYHVRVFDRPNKAAAARKPRHSARKDRTATASGNDVVSPMHGVVVEIPVSEGDAVIEGQVVAVVEAMKMMNEIRAHKAGAVTSVHAKAGETVESNSPLVTIG